MVLTYEAFEEQMLKPRDYTFQCPVDPHTILYRLPAGPPRQRLQNPAKGGGGGGTGLGGWVKPKLFNPSPQTP